MPLDWTKIDQATDYTNLDDVPEEIQDYTAKFIHDVGLRLGIDYPNGSYTGSSRNVLDFMQSGMMNRIYAQAEKIEVPGTRKWNPDYQPVEPEEMPMIEFTEKYARPMLFVKKHPIFITGELDYSTEKPGHAWVLDGWMRKTRSIAPAGESYVEDYAYCNYGWYGGDDGLYVFGIFYKYKYVNSIFTYNLQ